VSNPYDAPTAAGSRRAPAPGEDSLARVTGILAIVFAALELMFAAFAILGTAMGGVMTFTARSGDEGAFGAMILVLYIVIFLGAVTSGVLHMIGGIQLLRPAPNRTLVWLAAAGSLGSVLTVYCSIFGIVTAILMLVWLTRPAAHDPDILD